MHRNRQLRLASTTVNKLAASVTCLAMLTLAACGTTPKRPAFTGTDTVTTLTPDPFIGSWRYSVLNPIAEEERNVSAVYRFNPDGSFTANTDTNAEFPMKMESAGTWAIEGESFILSVEDVKETSGNQIAAFALKFTKAMLSNQSGGMNPYTITPYRIVMLSEEHGSAIQLDRMQ